MVQSLPSSVTYLLLMLRDRAAPVCPRAFAPAVPSSRSVLSHSFSCISLIILSKSL